MKQGNVSDEIIKRAEKADQYENTLKYIKEQLDLGGYGDRKRICEAVNKALEGTKCN